MPELPKVLCLWWLLLFVCLVLSRLLATGNDILGGTEAKMFHFIITLLSSGVAQLSIILGSGKLKPVFQSVKTDLTVTIRFCDPALNKYFTQCPLCTVRRGMISKFFSNTKFL